MSNSIDKLGKGGVKEKEDKIDKPIADGKLTGKERTQFKPGNKFGKGRKKGAIVSITSEIKKELAKIPKGEKANKLSQLIKVIFDKALVEKDDKMIGRIWNFVDGLPRQQTDIKLDTEIKVNILNYDSPNQIVGEVREIIKVIDKDTQ